MDTESFVQQAKQKGLSDTQIQGYLASKGVTYQPGLTPSPQASQQPQQGQGGNPFLSWLPTIGGIAGAGIGGLLGAETGPGALLTGAAGAGVGQAGGKALQEFLSGQNLNAGDIAKEGAYGAVGGALGGVLGKAAGGILGKAGEDLAAGGLKLTGKQTADFAAKHSGETVSQFLLRKNLAGADLGGLVEKGLNPTQSAFDSIANNDSVHLSSDAVVNALSNNASKVLDPLQASAVGSNKKLASSIDQELNNVLGSLSGKEADGITLKDINTIRKDYDGATSDTQFSPDAHPQTNRVTGTIVRKTVQDLSDGLGLSGKGQNLKELGLDLQKFYDLQDVAQGRTLSGGGGSPFSISNLLLGESGGIAAGAAGLNPALGMGGAILARKTLANPLIAGILSKGATNAAGPVAAGGVMGGAGIGGALGQVLSPGSLTPTGKENTKSQENQGQYNQSNPIISQTTGQIAQQDKNGNYILPDINKTNTPIPQIYPAENAIKDIQAASGDPIRLSQIQDAYQVSKGAAESYLQAHQLEPQEKGFMQNAQNSNEMFNELRGLIQKEGTGPINDVPWVQYLRSQKDPDYARMLTLMNTLKGQAVRAIEGGRPSNFDLRVLSSMPTAGDSTPSALAKINQTQKFMVDQYTRQLPIYTMSLQSGLPNLPIQQGPMVSPDQMALTQQIFGGGK